MALLILGLVLFIGSHIFTSLRGPRGQMVARLGENSYKLAYTAVSILGFVLIVYGFALYRANGMIPVWNPPSWTVHLAMTLMLPVFPLIIASYVRGNIFLKLKHPMLIGTLIWSVAHLIANGDLGSIILFGAFFVWTHWALISMKRRTDAGAPPLPQGGTTNDIIAVVAGLAIYGLFIWKLHLWLIGVPVMVSLV